MRRVIEWVYPIALLVASLANLNLLSLCYLLLFLCYFLWPPLYVAQNKWVIRVCFWVGAILFSSLACIGHGVFQILLITNSVDVTDTTLLFGFSGIASGGDAILEFAPDVCVLFASITSLVVLTKMNPDAKPTDDKRPLLSDAVTRHTILLAAGLIMPSLLNMVYVLAFLVLLLYPTKADNSVSTWVMIVYSAVHMLMQYIYHLSSTFVDVFSWSTVQALGLHTVYTPTWDASMHTLYVWLCMCTTLLVFLSHCARARQTDDVSIFSGETRTSVWRFMRSHGAVMCRVSAFVAALAAPSGLMSGLLCLAEISMLFNNATFRRFLPWMLFYAALSALLCYVFLIPSLGVALIGSLSLSHSLLRTPNAFGPVIVLALYRTASSMHSRTISLKSLLTAVRLGDAELIRSIYAHDPSIVHVKASRGQTLLHLAVSGGSMELAAFLIPLLDISNVNAIDDNGDTALHMAYTHGYTRIIKLLLRTPGLNKKLVNKRGFRANQISASCMTTLTRGIGRKYMTLQTYVLANAKYICLALIYITGMHDVNVIHVVYLLLFTLLLPSSSFARRLWPLLVAYSGLVVLGLYLWSVYARLLDDDTAIPGWIQAIGLEKKDTPHTWVDLILYFAAFIFSALQHHVHTLHSIRLSSSFQLSAYPWIRQLLSLLAQGVLLFGALTPPVSLLKLGYLGLFLLSLALSIMRQKHLYLAFWYTVALYSGVVLYTLYAFQFAAVRLYIQASGPMHISLLSLIHI